MLNETKVSDDEYKIQVTDMINSQIKLMADTGSMNSRMTNIEYFVDKYLPISVQKQISENLFSVLTNTQIHRFESF